MDDLLASTVEELLKGKGYALEKGFDETRPDLGVNAHWWTWSAAGLGIETGATHVFYQDMLRDALKHYFDNSQPVEYRL